MVGPCGPSAGVHEGWAVLGRSTPIAALYIYIVGLYGHILYIYIFFWQTYNIFQVEDLGPMRRKLLTGIDRPCSRWRGPQLAKHEIRMGMT